MLHRLTGFALLILLAAAALSLAPTPRAAAAASDDVPAWLKQAAAASAPAYDKKVPAVVLYNECSVIVSEDGRVTTTTNYAVRVLTHEGRDAAFARALYYTGSGKVRDFKAWLLRSTGDVKKYGKDETLDLALNADDVYDEARLRAISARDDVDAAAAVFGYQAVTEENTVFTQDDWNFQTRLPSLLSRYSLTLPTGWRASGVVFNHDRVEPTVSGTTYTWELKDLPFIEDEPNGPTMSSIVPRLAISFAPAGGASSALGPSLPTWAEGSRWVSPLPDPQAEPADAPPPQAPAL